MGSKHRQPASFKASPLRRTAGSPVCGQLLARRAGGGRGRRPGMLGFFTAATAMSLMFFSPSLAAFENWERFFGGAKRDTSFAVASFPDGSIVSAGYTRSFGNGDADIQLLRLSKSGVLQWRKTYGGAARDMATAVAPMPDGGSVTAAVSHMPGANGKKGQDDALIIRHDSKGNLLWKKRVGGASYDIPYAVKVDAKGRIIVVGYTKSKGHGDADGWIFSLDDKGELLWEHTYGGKGRDWLRSLTLLDNGDIAVAGGAKAARDEKHRNRDTHAWVMRLDQNGKMIWNHIFSKTESVSRTIVPLENGGVAVAGWVRTPKSITGRDIWVARLDGKGVKLWEKRLGGSGDDHTEALIALPGGDIALAGGTTKNLAVITVRAAWMLRLNRRGKLMWRRTFEGKSDQLFGLTSLPNGNLVACGTSWRRKNGADAWILTLDQNGHRAKRPSRHPVNSSIQ